jgi:hypothetical protein
MFEVTAKLNRTLFAISPIKAHLMFEIAYA